MGRACSGSCSCAHHVQQLSHPSARSLPDRQPHAGARHRRRAPQSPRATPAPARQEGAEVTGCISLMQVFYTLLSFWAT